MEQNWGLYSSYYGGERTPPISPHQSRDDPNSSHRRSIGQGGAFLPPPPPQSAPPPSSSAGVTLPPVSSAYGAGAGPSSHYSSSPTTMSSATAGPSSMSGQPQSMHMSGNPGLGYGSHIPVSQPVSAYHYPVPPSSAPMSVSQASSGRPHGYSPRIPGGYPSMSPAMNTFSPVSPSMAYPQPPSTAGSVSSFPPSMPQSRFEPTSEFKKRRTNSGSTTSWEGYALSRPGVSSGGTDKCDDDDQPWGMPQEQYKALNPRDKKQVRNRIGARRFRAKRKDYVSQLESAKKENEAKIAELQAQVETQHREINDLRSRLNLAPLPPPVDSLGINVSASSSKPDSGSGPSMDPIPGQ